MYKLTCFYDDGEIVNSYCANYEDVIAFINKDWQWLYDRDILVEDETFVYEVTDNNGDTTIYGSTTRINTSIDKFSYHIDNELIQSIKFGISYKEKRNTEIGPFTITLEKIDENKKESKEMEKTKTFGADDTKALQEKDDSFTVPIHVEKEGNTMEKIPDNLEKSIKYHWTTSAEYGTYIKAEKLCEAILENFECDDAIKEILENTIARAHKERAKKDAARKKAREEKRSERWRCTVPIVKRILEEEGMVTYSTYIDYCSKINNYDYAGIRSTYEFAQFLVQYAKEYANVRLSMDNVFTLYSVSYLKEKYNI